MKNLLLIICLTTFSCISFANDLCMIVVAESNDSSNFSSLGSGPKGYDLDGMNREEYKSTKLEENGDGTSKVRRVLVSKFRKYSGKTIGTSTHLWAKNGTKVIYLSADLPENSHNIKGNKETFKLMDFKKYFKPHINDSGHGDNFTYSEGGIELNAKIDNCVKLMLEAIKIDQAGFKKSSSSDRISGKELNEKNLSDKMKSTSGSIQ